MPDVRAVQETIQFQAGSPATITVTAADAEGAPVDVTGLSFVVALRPTGTITATPTDPETGTRAFSLTGADTTAIATGGGLYSIANGDEAWFVGTARASTEGTKAQDHTLTATVGSAAQFNATLAAYIGGGGGGNLSVADRITLNGLRHPGTLGSIDPIALEATDADPIAEYATGDWDSSYIRELGSAVYDPTTEQWIVVYSGRNLLNGFSSIGAAISDDGETWAPHPQNPICPTMTVDYLGALLTSEDPYLAITVDREVYRDSAGRALLFTEEKDGSTHRGINLWRSAPGTLSDWTLFGQVLPPEDEGSEGYGSRDRSSPTVIHDGTQLVMLFEFRHLQLGPDPVHPNEGETGIAYSTDDGETFTATADVILARGPAGSWYDRSIVPDDLIKVGDVWVLLAHGQHDESYDSGRWVTLDDPADWGPDSFTEYQGNPVTLIDTLMCFGNDPTRAVWINSISHAIQHVQVVAPKDSEQDGRLDSIEGVNSTQDGRLDGVEGKNNEQDGRLDDLEAVGPPDLSGYQTANLVGVTESTALAGQDAGLVFVSTKDVTVTMPPSGTANPDRPWWFVNGTAADPGGFTITAASGDNPINFVGDIVVPAGDMAIAFPVGGGLLWVVLVVPTADGATLNP